MFSALVQNCSLEYETYNVCGSGQDVNVCQKIKRPNCNATELQYKIGWAFCFGMGILIAVNFVVIITKAIGK